MIDPRLLERKKLLFDASLHEAAGSFHKAAECYRDVIAFSDPDWRLHHLLAVALRKSGNAEAAGEIVQAALELFPGQSELIAEQAEIAIDGNDPERASLLLEDALRNQSDNEVIRLRLAELLLERGEYAAAGYHADRADEDKGLLRARIAFASGEFMQAAQLAEVCLAADPSDARCRALLVSGRLIEGNRDAALSLARGMTGTDAALIADAFKDAGEPELAIDLYEKALESEPEDIDIRFNLATAQLTCGRYDAGADAYRCRWERPGKTKRPFTPPFWQGEDLAGKHLLVWTEQGLGEEILHLTAIASLIDTASSVTIETTDRLVPMVQRAFPDATVVPRTMPPRPETVSPAIDLQCPAGDLLRFMQPGETEYAPSIAADPDLTAEFRNRYHTGQEPGIRAGLCWSTERTPAAASKSVPTQLMMPLLAIPGIDWISLQFGKQGLREAEILQMHSGGRLTIDETVDPLTDLDRQAAQIASLDLVVSISTTAAHMAGALGVKSFLLLNSRPLWHWGNARNHCPWYPQADLIRQQRPGDWTAPLMRLRRKLERLAEAA